MVMSIMLHWAEDLLSCFTLTVFIQWSQLCLFVNKSQSFRSSDTALSLSTTCIAWLCVWSVPISSLGFLWNTWPTYQASNVKSILCQSYNKLESSRLQIFCVIFCDIQQPQNPRPSTGTVSHSLVATFTRSKSIKPFRIVYRVIEYCSLSKR